MRRPRSTEATEALGCSPVTYGLFFFSDVLSDLLMTEAATPTSSALPLSCQPMVMEATLIAPTANGLKQGCPAVTYVNRGIYTFY